MNRRWKISILLSVLLVIGGTMAGIYIMKVVPSRLNASSVLDQPKLSYEKEVQVPKETKDIIYESQKVVVQVEIEDGTIGSGFLYNDQGDVITNGHVVANHKNVRVVSADSKEMPGEVIGISRDTDIAVIRVPGLKGREPLPILTKGRPQLLDEVLALGSPLGMQNTVTEGEISGLDRNFKLDPFTYENIYQISAPISPGNSGGPLLDRKTGEVVGINSAKLGKESIGFSIPIIDVLPIVKKWSTSPMKSLPEFPELAESDQSIVAGTETEKATYLVQYFYDSINQGDFVTAYSLIGSRWQQTISYQEFREGYFNTLTVKIDHSVADPKGNYVEVTAFITAEETKDGEVVLKKYKVTYPVKYENDSLKILEGSGEKVSVESNE